MTRPLPSALPLASSLRRGVRPIVLALAPPPAGSARSDLIPSLTMLGGSRLIDRLLAMLAEAGLPAPLVAARSDVADRLRHELGGTVEVIGAAGDRLDVLRAVLTVCDEPLLLIHDAERALMPAAVIHDVLAGMSDGVDAVVPVQAMTDSVKEIHPGGLRNVDRTTLAAMQSPRLVRRNALLPVLSEAATDGDDGTAGRPADEILALLNQGSPVGTVHGSHAGFAVVDRLSLWQAQISLGLARDTSARHGPSLRPGQRS